MFCEDCGKTNEECSCSHSRSRAREARDTKEQDIEAILEKFADKVAQKRTRNIEEMLDARLEKIVDVKVNRAIEPPKQRLTALESKFTSPAATRSRSLPAGGFVPGFIEIKGFVDKFEEAKTSGISKQKADELLNILKTNTPEEFKESIGNAETYGDRSFSIKVPVHDHISEVNRVWRFHLKSNLWEGRELFTTLEKTPEKKAKYNTLGKIKNMLKT